MPTSSADHRFLIVGAGTAGRPQASVIPAGVTWLRDAAAEFDPDNNAVTTAGGTTIGYDQLVVALGLQLHLACPG